MTPDTVDIDYEKDYLKDQSIPKYYIQLENKIDGCIAWTVTATSPVPDTPSMSYFSVMNVSRVSVPVANDASIAESMDSV